MHTYTDEGMQQNLAAVFDLWRATGVFGKRVAIVCRERVPHDALKGLAATVGDGSLRGAHVADVAEQVPAHEGGDGVHRDESIEDIREARLPRREGRSWQGHIDHARGEHASVVRTMAAR